MIAYGDHAMDRNSGHGREVAESDLAAVGRQAQYYTLQTFVR